jgi:CheY-like chemotaxis protein
MPNVLHQTPPEVSAQLQARALIVVEDRMAGKHLSQLLAAMGYEGVRVVRRAASALYLARQYSPSLVFLDIALSDNVHTLANALRRQAGHGALRLIALTNGLEPSTLEPAGGGGFERWLVTPVTQGELDNLLCAEAAAV